MQVVKQLLQGQLAIFLLRRGQATLAPLYLLPQLLTASATGRRQLTDTCRASKLRMAKAVQNTGAVHGES